MKDVFGAFSENVQVKFDLKGSTLNRKVQLENKQLEKIVMKDINFKESEQMIFLDNIHARNLQISCKQDSEFLSECGVMDYSLLVVKCGMNTAEMIKLYGENHRNKMEKIMLKMQGIDAKITDEECDLEKEIKIEDGNIVNNKKNNNIEIHDQNEPDEDFNKRKISHEELNFDPNKIKQLDKYRFPSLYGSQFYIISIIDFFQTYTSQKYLETKVKKFIKGVQEAEISSMPPKEYQQRFMANVKRLTDTKTFFKQNNSSNDFEELA